MLRKLAEVGIILAVVGLAAGAAFVYAEKKLPFADVFGGQAADKGDDATAAPAPLQTEEKESGCCPACSGVQDTASSECPACADSKAAESSDSCCEEATSTRGSAK